MRWVAGFLLVVSGFQEPSAPRQGVWPPAGVYTQKDGALPPVLLSRVEPGYTPDAMRAKLRGFVTLQCVVEIDGSVSAVRVQTSLDRTHGLDDQAVAALKQWRFKPGTRNGEVVRVLTTVTMTFNINGLPPPMTLPAGFDAAPEAVAARVVFETVEQDGVQMRMGYPDGWVSSGSATVAILVADPSSIRSIGIYRPLRSPAPLPFPMPLRQLAQFSSSMQASQFKSGQSGDILAVGQSPFGNANWLWLEMEVSTAHLPGTSADTAAAIRDRVDGAHLWSFTTSVGVQVIMVNCVAAYDKGASEVDRTNTRTGGAADCARVLKTITFTPR